ncbi:MAG TPA: hypothetical protein VKA37_11155 [Halobacteriales archaeon]|nr:hypothetical protein [Halobacteriales archaeon]
MTSSHGLRRSSLLLTPGSTDECDRACARQLHVPGDEHEAVIFVTLTDTTDQRSRVLKRHAKRPPARLGVICSGESRRGGALRQQGIAIRTVENPDDLARLGVGISDALSSWADDHPTTVCFHSLTALLQFVDLSRAFRFVYTLFGRVAARGAHAHFHLDPNAHDDQTVATLKPLFDEVLRVDEDETSLVS